MGMDTLMSSYWTIQAIINVVVALIFCARLMWRKRWAGTPLSLASQYT